MAPAQQRCLSWRSLLLLCCRWQQPFYCWGLLLLPSRVSAAARRAVAAEGALAPAVLAARWLMLRRLMCAGMLQPRRACRQESEADNLEGAKRAAKLGWKQDGKVRY